MQISYLYASDFPAHQTSKGNNNKTDPKQSLAMIKHFLIVLGNAQINQRNQSKKSTVAVTFIRKSEEMQTIARTSSASRSYSAKYEVLFST